jgi:hypothetical protein
MATQAEVALAQLSPPGLPSRLCWIADSTFTEKPSAQRGASLGLLHRTQRGAGRAKPLTGHRYVFAAPLYPHLQGHGQQWASVLVGALLSVNGRSIPTSVGARATHLRLPAGVRHVWSGDRGMLSRPLLRTRSAQGHFAVGRLRCNQVASFAPRPRSARQRRPQGFGQACRVDQLLSRVPHWLRAQPMVRRVRGRERGAKVWAAEGLLRGVWPGQALPARVLRVVVPQLNLPPWYRLCTALTLAPLEAGRTCAGRCQIAGTFDEVQELGLGYSQGRSGQGVRRWPLFLWVTQLLRKFIAPGALPLPRPTRNWPWYKQGNTVGQVRRRLIELCRPPISVAERESPLRQQLANAA